MDKILIQFCSAFGGSETGFSSTRACPEEDIVVQNASKPFRAIFSLPVIVAALGYFVDI